MHAMLRIREWKKVSRNAFLRSCSGSPNAFELFNKLLSIQYPHQDLCVYYDGKDILLRVQPEFQS